MKKLIPLLSSICLGLSAPAFAQLGDTSDGETSTAHFGAVGLYTSEYFGSGDEEFIVLPFLDLDDYKGFDFYGTTLSYRAIETGTGQGLGKWSLRVGPSVTYVPGRDASDSETLDGLTDVDGSLLAGGYIRSTIGPVGLRFDAGQDVINGTDGFNAVASIGTSLPLGKLFFQPSASVSFASANFNESFFGISEAQAEASGLAVNDVDSGIYNYSVNLISHYPVSEHFRVELIGSYRWFANEANNSPIITAADGSDQGFFVGMGLTRKFNFP